MKWEKPNHYRCPYCGHKTHTRVAAESHARDCDDKYPGYVEVYTRYIDLRESEEGDG